MKKVFGTLALLAFAGAAHGQGGTSIGAATNWAGPQTVTGAFSAVQSSETLVFSQDYTVDSTNSLAEFTIGSLTAGNAYRARTGPAAGGGSYDTRLRVRNSGGTTLGENDDFSGLGLFSQVSGTVPGDGILQVQGAYWQNTSWTNPFASTPAGAFNMSLYAVTITAPGVSTQWYRFSGLGGSLEAEVMNAVGVTDTVMAAFDSSGTMFAYDDDGGVGFQSLISGVSVPGDGIVYLAVTYYHGLTGQDTNAYYDNNINYTGSGTFDLRVVPAPGSVALVGLAGLVVGRRRR